MYSLLYTQGLWLTALGSLVTDYSVEHFSFQLIHFNLFVLELNLNVHDVCNLRKGQWLNAQSKFCKSWTLSPPTLCKYAKNWQLIYWRWKQLYDRSRQFIQIKRFDKVSNKSKQEKEISVQISFSSEGWELHKFERLLYE